MDEIQKVQNMNIERIREEINNRFRIDITKHSRKRDLLWPRYCFYRIVKDNFKKVSLTYIGSFVGDKDHASVLHGLRQFEMLNKYEDFMLIYNDCVDACGTITSSLQDCYNRIFALKTTSIIEKICSVEILKDISECCTNRINTLLNQEEE